MVEKLISDVLQYGGYAVELILVCLLVFRGHYRRLVVVTFYVSLLFLTDGVVRRGILDHYGISSRKYWYCFWLTDVLLALASFLVVCSFFRRACLREDKMWRFIRQVLVCVFILVLGISSFSLSRNYSQLTASFIVEFEQNLCFTCVVLNTLLYLLMQQIESPDEELGLLVCGIGIQYAGPAASFALAHLTFGEHYSEFLIKLMMPVCTLGMLLTWFYAVVRMPKVGVVRAAAGKFAGVEEAAAGRV